MIPGSVGFCKFQNMRNAERGQSHLSRSPSDVTRGLVVIA